MAKKSTQDTYISNPFKLIFKGADKLFTSNQTWAIIIIVVGFILGFPGSFNYGYSPSTNNNGEPSSTVVLLLLLLPLLFLTLYTIINVYYRGAVAYVVLKTIKGEKAGVKEALKAAGNKFWVILWTQVVVGLKIFGGLLLLIVPGVRAALRYNMVLLPVFAKDKKTKEAIAEMKDLTKDHLIEVFGMTTASGIIPIVGSMLGVGGQVIMYPQLTKLKKSSAPKPPVHWLNYLAFLLMAFLILFVFSIAGLIFLLISASHH